MMKRKQLFSCIGGVVASFALALAVFVPGTKASAKLAVETVDYENSTITISTDSNDSVLYFSDKKKKKWETALDSFDSATKRCTMDISWVSLTKDYVITFKGDKSNKSDDILELTIPKQVKNFKAKYDKRSGKVNFTNDASREIQYRKNNTSQWNDVPKKNNAVDTDALSSILKRFCDNGASVYFRLKAENGNGTDPGKRYSKEVACSVTKKTNAPKITINPDATISVTQGLQVRRVDVEKVAGLLYITGYNRIDGVADTDVDEKKWYTYQTSKDVPVTEMAADIGSNSTSGTEVYLQFKKAATSTTQESRSVTLRIPKQGAAPTIEEAGLRKEFTSSKSFKLTFGSASTTNPYEYCAVDNSDVKKDANGKAINMISPSDATWKTVNTSSGVEVKQADAPDGCWIFFRKKAVGTVGDDDFKLSTPYTVYGQITYPQPGASGEIKNGTFSLIDGVCREGNADGYLHFQITTKYDAKISQVKFGTNANPTTSDTAATAKVTSTTTKLEDGSYSMDVTMTDLQLSSEMSTKLQNDGTIKLYGFIQFSNNETISSGETTGLVITVSRKSEIEKTNLSGQNKINVEHFVGITTTTGGGVASTPSNAYDFNFKVKYGNSNTEIERIKYGNYILDEGTHYTKQKTGDEETITIKMKAMEDDSNFISYYNKTQNIIVELKNGEKLTDVKLTLVEPVSLDKVYAWAFSRSSLIDKQVTTTIGPDNSVTSKEEPVNSYSVSYSQSAKTCDNGGSSNNVSAVSFARAELKGVDITNKGDTNTIEFSNAKLKTVPSAFSEPVIITFTITYSGGRTCEYKVRKGCTFTIL